MSDEEDYMEDEWEAVYDDGFGAQAVSSHNPLYFLEYSIDTCRG
jgi:hypothetical protein